MDINIDYVREQLKRRASERQLARVARGSKVNLRTLHYIIAGRSGHIDTITKLQEFLRKHQRKAKLDHGGE